MIVKCPSCDCDDLKESYNGKIRSGPPGSVPESGYRIYQCNSCELSFIYPLPDQHQTYYAEGGYWSTRERMAGKVNLREKLQREQKLWLDAIGIENFENKDVVEFGCGLGLFLDQICNIASSTIGVDLDPSLLDILEENGHVFFEHTKDLSDDSADIIISFDTLEHVHEPLKFCREVKRVLRRGGRCFIGVPNNNDFLKSIVNEYLQFFYHKSHLLYFSFDSLRYLFSSSGIAVDKIQSIHKYDIMNMIKWAAEKKGVGNIGSSVFDNITEAAFKSNLQRQGIGSHILLSGRLL